jgi:hypothetical protein
MHDEGVWESIREVMLSVSDDIASEGWRAWTLAVELSTTVWGRGQRWYAVAPPRRHSLKTHIKHRSLNL